MEKLNKKVVSGNNLYFAKVRDRAIIPTKSVENAGFDFYACVEGEDIVIKPQETVMVPTGVACAMSDDYYMQLFERGSTGSIGLKESCGVIDSSYRGEVFAALYNGSENIIVITDKVKEKQDKLFTYGDYFTEKAILYPRSKAICQGVVLPVPKMEVHGITYEELLGFETERGCGKLGSSNK